MILLLLLVTSSLAVMCLLFTEIIICMYYETVGIMRHPYYIMNMEVSACWVNVLCHMRDLLSEFAAFGMGFCLHSTKMR